MLKTTELLIEKLKEFEGLRLEAYEDAAGVLTIGYGHTGRDVCKCDCISRQWAEMLLREDVEKAERLVRSLNVAKTDGQLDALVSFVFNLGIERLRKSTLLKVIREGGSASHIRKEFKKWVYAGGQRLSGLEKRREWEAKRFLDPTPSLPRGGEEGRG